MFVPLRMLAPWRPGPPTRGPPHPRLRPRGRRGSRSPWRSSAWRCVLAAPADASVLGPRAGHSPNADDIRTAYWVAIVVAALLILAINAFLVAALVRFRARRGLAPKRLAAGPGAFLRPAVPLAGDRDRPLRLRDRDHERRPRRAADDEPGPERLRQPGRSGRRRSRSRPTPSRSRSTSWASGGCGDSTTRRRSTSRRTRTFSYNELVVPVHTTVILHVTSTDVDHRWFVPALGGQVEAVPGHDSDTWFRADRDGRLPGPVDRVLGHLLRRHARLGQGREPAAVPAVRQAEADVRSRPRRTTCRRRSSRAPRRGRQRHEPSDRSGPGAA